MDLPQIDENAGWLAGIVFLGSVLRKVWLRFKADSRNDKSAERDHDAEGKVLGGYDQLIKQLRSEVERLAISVSHMSEALDEERNARYAAESIAIELRQRIESLERRLRDLGHTP